MMKRAVKVLVVLALIGVAAVGAWWGYNQMFGAGEAWYVQVDNTRLTQAGENNNDFPYHYDLPAVDAAGEERELGFDTSRQLREGAYLHLTTLALRGVVRWEEVAWEEIPAPAQEKLAPPVEGSGDAA